MGIVGGVLEAFSGRCSVAQDRLALRRRHDRDRGSQACAQGHAAQGLRLPSVGGELIDLVSNIRVGDANARVGDVSAGLTSISSASSTPAAVW